MLVKTKFVSGGHYNLFHIARGRWEVRYEADRLVGSWRCERTNKKATLACMKGKEIKPDWLKRHEEREASAHHEYIHE